jgi:N-dimethylarginine dimethylaminohydrolase
MDPRKQYEGKLEDYPLTNYPDYEPGHPPRSERLETIGFLDEVEKIWGSRWGGSAGIGRLREVALIKPTEHEVDPLWEKDRNFFLLRRVRVDVDKLKRAFEDYAQVLESVGVRVRWMDAPQSWGAYGPMRKLFMGAFPLVIKGGAIVSRQGQASFMRGVEVNFTKFFASINCPILHTIHGHGICEVGVFVPIAEDVIMGFKSCASNDDGLEQVLSVFKRSEVKEMPIAHSTTIIDDFEAGGEFHVDMVLGVVDIRKVVVYPGYLDYNIYRWLKDRKFQIIEVPKEEHHRFYPANLVLIEPGKVIMAKGATETIRRVREAGAEVIELDTTGLMAGTNGIRCVTLPLVRDPGPGLD